MGFGPNFWRWITLLYSDPRTVIRLGLLTSEPFVVGRGTRQGCPLSPFLFALMMEPIARALRQSREVGAIQVGSIQENLTLYADDLLLFLRDPRTSLQAALRILDRFASFSGLRVNWTKSLILPVEPEAQKKKRSRRSPITVGFRHNLPRGKSHRKDTGLHTTKSPSINSPADTENTGLEKNSHYL